MSVDTWGQPVAADDTVSVAAWDAAWAEALHFVGDPFERLSTANENDAGFALGSIFTATYRVLGGAPFDDPLLLTDVKRARERSHTQRERSHLDALDALVAGNFSAAATLWDRVATDHDLAAVRFAHDVFLHCGDAVGRLHSSERAFDRWKSNDPGWGAVASMHSFALEEVGRFAEAERIGWQALEFDPLDLWALHALAHVYEETDAQEDALALMENRQETWSNQDSLAVHIWWHLALRLIAARRFEEVLDLHDQLVPAASTPFRLSDLASMLWRLELCSVDVGDRWNHLADSFAARPERYTTGFLDMHAAMVFSRCPDHPDAREFFTGIERAHVDGTSENANTFQRVAVPLVRSLQLGASDPGVAAEILGQLDPVLHRIGGSVAQRNIVPLTCTHWRRRAKEQT